MLCLPGQRLLCASVLDSTLTPSPLPLPHPLPLPLFQFVEEVHKIVSQLKVGSSLGDSSVDCGAICMGPRAIEAFQDLVDDAVRKGARLICGGRLPRDGASGTGEPGAPPPGPSKGSFYPPTVLADVPENATIAQKEIFGPILCIFRVKGNSDDEAVRMANNCDFALSSCAFSADAARAKRVASRLNAGMSCVNDLEGTTYMNQSLPFGGCKKSGYDRFAGPEGLRGLCMVRSCCEDRVSFIRNSIPPPMHYPASGAGPSFAWGLIRLFFSTSLWGNLQGVVALMTNMGAKPGMAAGASASAGAGAGASASAGVKVVAGGGGGGARGRSASRSRKTK